MEVPKIIKLLRMAADSRYSQTPELLYEAADALERLTASPKNKPLTLDELRRMNGKPVYLVVNDGESTLQMWALVCVDDVNYPRDRPVILRNYCGGHEMFFSDKELEQEQISAYAHNPEVHTLKIEELPKPNTCRNIPPKEEI